MDSIADCPYSAPKSHDFQRWKATAFAKVDLSKKGSVDTEIQGLIGYINQLPNYFTTSSCSGRVVVCSDDPCISVSKLNSGVAYPKFASKKQGCQWYFASHVTVNAEDAIAALAKVTESCKLKFEPFILHVQCSTLKHAQTIHTAAVEAGFRNSGITIGKGGKKMMAAVRGSACLEVPLTTIEGKRLTSDEYVGHIVNIANRKLMQNFSRIKVFEEKLRYAVDNLNPPKISNQWERDKVRKENRIPADIRIPPKKNSDIEENVDVDIRAMFELE